MNINILVTLDSNYLKPLKVMLDSLFVNNPQDEFSVYLMHSSLTDEELASLDQYISARGHRLEIVNIDDRVFTNAPTLLHYTKEMYYRLLAFKFLPQDLDRILYLDPDILVINSVRGLYTKDLDRYLYAAAYHGLANASIGINKLRLSPYTIENYYNSGVLLMNLELQRQTIDEQEIFDFVDEYRTKLVMPDQDILNALYSNQILDLDERLYNYDARYYNYYNLVSKRRCNMDYVINHTAILHFCGKKKPWNEDYSGKFHALYKHYEKQALGTN